LPSKALHFLLVEVSDKGTEVVPLSAALAYLHRFKISTGLLAQPVSCFPVHILAQIFTPNKVTEHVATDSGRYRTPSASI
jgi:hypothetical protein